MSAFNCLVPPFQYTSTDRLGKGLVWMLNSGHHTPTENFILMPYDGGIVLLNKDYPNIERIKEIVLEYVQIDEKSRCWKRCEKLYEEFKSLTDKNACDMLFFIDNIYSKRREKARCDKDAREVLKRIRKNHLSSKRRRKEKIIYALYNIGWDEKTINGGFQKGAEYCFLYGYLSAIEDMRKGGAK